MMENYFVLCEVGTIVMYNSDKFQSSSGCRGARLLSSFSRQGRALDPD